MNNDMGSPWHSKFKKDHTETLNDVYEEVIGTTKVPTPVSSKEELSWDTWMNEGQCGGGNCRCKHSDDKENKDLLEELLRSLQLDEDEEANKIEQQFVEELDANETLIPPSARKAIVAELHNAASNKEKNGIDELMFKGDLHAFHTHIEVAKALRIAANFLDGVQAR